MECTSKLESLIMSFRSKYEEYENETRIDTDTNRCMLCGYEWDRNPKHPEPKLCPSCKSTLWNHSDVMRHLCKRCDHVWFSLDEHPMRCPSCKSKVWDSQYLVVRCVRCDTKWKDPMRVQKTFRCPKCGPVDLDDIKIVSRHVPEQKEQPIRKSPLQIDVGLADSLISLGDHKERLYMLSAKGYPDDEVDILCSFIDGQDPITMARDRNIPLNDVMMAIAPFAILCEKEGRMPWISM